jgi:uncharacterized protein (UPF0216 family)
VDDATLRRLLANEAHKVNQGTVAEPVPLREVVSGRAPRAKTRNQTWHAFDPAEVVRFRAALSPLVASFLVVPITFWIDHRLSGMCAITDETAREALLQHGLHVAPIESGRAWISEARAKDFARRWPTLTQFMRL